MAQDGTADGAFDPDRLAALMGMLGAARMRELAGTFAEQAVAYAADIGAALERADLDAARAAAHKMGSMAGTFGAAGLHRQVGAIEDACVEGRADEAASLAAGLPAQTDAAVRWALAGVGRA